MGTDFRHTCQLETRKFLWLVGLVLGSVFIVQYFELPYRESMLSLLSSGKAYFNSSKANTVGNDDIGKSYAKNNSSPSPKPFEGNISHDNLMLESTTNMSHTSEEETIVRSIGLAPENADADRDNSTGSLISGWDSIAAISPKSPDFLLAPMVSPSESISSRKTGTDLVAPVVAVSPPLTSPDGNATSVNVSNEGSREQNSSIVNNPPRKEPVASVVSISEMNDLLLHGRASSFSKNPLWPSAADRELLDARFQIENAAIVRNRPGLYAPIYRNLSRFIRSYEIMEQKLKVYIYKEGKSPVFHEPRLRGIYASEGWFMKHMKSSNQFITTKPEEAHLFYFAFSSQLLASYVYVPNSHSFDSILTYLKEYLDTIKAKHSFWNRTQGADHFVVGCHDWAAYETRHVMPNTIRALCNSDVKEGFQFGKDVSLPETYVHSPKDPLEEVGGRQSSGRKILAFFAGQMHGSVRPLLLQHWENKDPDMKIVGKLRKGYAWHMKNSKYCICAKGYEVNSPRVVEAIAYGCVPVIISDNFVPPFFEVLNWDSFAVFVLEKDIPELKDILVSISEKRYAFMQKRVGQVRQHFLWHKTPVRYDIFHMILHSIWYNRVFRMLPK